MAVRNRGTVNRRAKSIGNATGKCTFPERWTEMKSGRNENPSEECLFRSNEIERDMIGRERERRPSRFSSKLFLRRGGERRGKGTGKKTD